MDSLMRVLADWVKWLEHWLDDDCAADAGGSWDCRTLRVRCRRLHGALNGSAFSVMSPTVQATENLLGICCRYAFGPCFDENAYWRAIAELGRSTAQVAFWAAVECPRLEVRFEDLRRRGLAIAAVARESMLP